MFRNSITDASVSTSFVPPAVTRHCRLTVLVMLLTVMAVITCAMLNGIHPPPATSFNLSILPDPGPPTLATPMGPTKVDKLNQPFSFPPAPVEEMEEKLESEDGRLDKVLKEAATEEKTVILTNLNAAWASPGSMIDLFLESFKIGNGTQKLLNHLIIITIDPKAYRRCELIHSHCFALVTKGIDLSEDKFYMTPGYLEIVWRRIDVMRKILEKGYNFIFSDGDIMWFRNPLLHFYPDGDFQVACDECLGNASDLNNKPNAGFLYAKANNRTIAFIKFWYSSRESYPGRGNQYVFNSIKYNHVIRDIGVKIRYLSTDYFGGICVPSRDLNKVCTMHANCCVGLKDKIHDLRVMLDDWKKYMSLPSSKKSSTLYSWSLLQFHCRGK